MSFASIPLPENPVPECSPPVDRNDPQLLSSQRAVLKRLKAWHRWEQGKQRSLFDYILRTSPAIIPRPALPTDDELLSLAQYYFPLRDNLEVWVWDYSREEDDFHLISSKVTTLKYIDQYLVDKPSSIFFRWIHAPVGAGWLNRAIEKKFGEAVKESNIPINTVYFKVLSLRDSNIVQDQLDVFNLLQDTPGLRWDLRKAWSSTYDFGDVEEVNNNFWKAAASDMPGPLAPTSMIDPSRFRRGQTSKDFLSTKQHLGRHQDYENLMLTTDNMTCVSRNDGVLLTMLSSKGLNYLNASRSYLPWPDVMRSPPEFALAHLAYSVRPSHYAKIPLFVGEPSHYHYMELKLLDIIEAFYTTPLATGIETSGLEEAYEQIVQELKNRGSKRLRRQESLALVQDFISCMNEISQLQKVIENKTKTFRSLLKNVFAFDDSHTETAIVLKRRNFIKSYFESHDENNERLPLLYEELKSSLDVFFQLKTIEQNEMALLAESNNQAILVFTVVTVVFLPLSFFTSYFGMNLEGIANTTKDERYFWRVCGPVTVSIVLLTLLFGFRKRFRDVLWSDQTFTRSRK